jgi:hypothetical protein
MVPCLEVIKERSADLVRGPLSSITLDWHFRDPCARKVPSCRSEAKFSCRQISAWIRNFMSG